MNRREALSSVALLLGGTLIGSEMFLSGCTNENKKIGTAGLDFSPEDVSFLDEVGDTIIPATDTPGAKDAKIGEFMHTIVRDCYNKTDQDIFIAGMGKLNEASKSMNGKYFLESTPEERKNLLITLDKEQKDYKGHMKALELTFESQNEELKKRIQELQGELTVLQMEMENRDTKLNLAFANFKAGDYAMFLPDKNGHYQAVNNNSPNYFLSPFVLEHFSAQR